VLTKRAVEQQDARRRIKLAEPKSGALADVCAAERGQMVGVAIRRRVIYLPDHDAGKWSRVRFA
jgi:hypothetical protein